jgi:hemoglobin
MGADQEIKDIVNRDDVEHLVSEFYADVLEDPIIGFIFTDIARIDLQSHQHVIVDFWCSILFKTRDYKGDALGVHQSLDSKVALKQGHFTRWLYLFARHVDNNFSGQNADLIKARAELIAKAIIARLKGLDKRDLELVLGK